MINTHIAIYTIDIIALLFLFGLLYGDNLMGRYRKKSFSYGIVVTIFVILAEAGTIMTSNGTFEFRNLNVLCNLAGFMLAPIIPIILTDIFDTKILKTYKWLILPTVLNIIMTMLSPLFGLIFYVDKSNHYQRGSMFFFFVVVYIFNILLLAISTWYASRKYFFPIKRKIITLFFFTVTCTCIQVLFPSVYSSWHCVTLSLLFLYILLSEFESSFDTLTGLYNRAAFEKAPKQLNLKKPFTIVAMDVNDFKKMNDTYGHDYGDLVLKEVGKIIKESFDKNCSCYRIGGDEFCVILRELNKDKLEIQFKNMTNNLAKKRQNDKNLPTISYGYGFSKGEEVFDFQTVLKVADEQMYYHKNLQKKKEEIK